MLLKALTDRKQLPHMLKANIKSAFFTSLITTGIFLVGCSSPEEKKDAQIEDALSLSQEGSNQEALEILEALAAQYPNDIEILTTMGQIYSAEGDPTMAAFFLEQAYLQAPDDTELLFQTYQSLEAANQPAIHMLEKLALQAPAAMTPTMWVRLGQLRKNDNKLQPALDAYLKGVDPDNEKPSPETAAAIGQLFVKLGNLAQAEAWLEIAADSDDPNALTALFGLLEINLRQKDWANAERVVAQLNTQFPGAIEASQWKQARDELARWRKAQDEMKAELARTEKIKQAAQAEADAAAEKTAKATGAKAETAAAEGSEGKAQVIADLEAAEAMADAPAIEFEVATDSGTAVAITNNAIAFDPSIAIEPADPEITFEVGYDQENMAVPTTYTIDRSPPLEAETVEVELATAEPATAEDNFATFGRPPEPQADSPIPNDRPRTIDELLADAETAEFDRNYKSAIRKYWAAIGMSNNRPEIWNLLSRAYLVDGQTKNAETASLEAVRLDPSEVAYTLDYLRVAQRSKTPEAFLTDLETAYARFPRSPEITLSLARGHERISKQAMTARNLYLRFIDLAPNHPLVPEARAAVARL